MAEEEEHLEEMESAPEGGGGGSKRKIVSRWDKIWLVVILLIFAYVAFQKLGIKMTHKTTDTEVIHSPSSGK